MLALSLGAVTSVCVCEPRHVWTAASCFGFVKSVMSKMRTPRKRSGLTASVTPCVPQSMRPRVSSTDMKSRLPYTDTSPWPPGQTIDAMSFGDGESLMSYALKPLKLPAMARSWLKARSEFANLRKPADAAGAAACPDAGVEALGCPDAGVEAPGGV